MKGLHIEVRGWDEAEARVMPVRTEDTARVSP